MPKFITFRTVLWLGVPVLLLAASCGAALGAVRLVRAEGDRVEILGSGAGVSILVTTGRTELLLATGTDRTAFGNAYDQISIAPGSRPDILLLAGTDRDRSLNVPTSAIDLFTGADAYTIYPLDSGSTGDIDFEALSPLPRNPIRFTLDERIVVVVESLPIDAGTGTYAWRAVVTREATRIAVISSVDGADLFSWPDPISVLVVAGDASNSDSSPAGAAAIIGSAVTLDPPSDERDTESNDSFPAHVVPVRPGSVATATFVPSGVELTSDDHMYRAGRPV